MSYPINLNLKDKKCLVVGGGSVAERKVSGLLAAGGEVTVISPEITENLKILANEKKIIWIQDAYKSGMAKGYFLLIAATNSEEANILAINEAKSFGALVNAPANPALSDFSVPAVMRRGDLSVAITTEGISPALSRIIKEEIGEFVPKNIDKWLEFLKDIRKDMKEKLKTSKDRENFWRKALNKKIFTLLKEGRLKEAEVELRDGVSCDWAKP